MDSFCGTEDRAVASDNSGNQFETRLWQSMYLRPPYIDGGSVVLPAPADPGLNPKLTMYTFLKFILLKLKLLYLLLK